MLGRERRERAPLHRTSQDWGLWRRSRDWPPPPLHYHKAHYVSSLDLGLDYRWVLSSLLSALLIPGVVQGQGRQGKSLLSLQILLISQV